MSASYFELDSKRLFLKDPPLEKLRQVVDGVGAKSQSGEIGFVSWPETLKKGSDLNALQTCAEKMRSQTQGALIFGIGGSYLGAATLVRALCSPEQLASYPLVWMANADPPAFANAEFALNQRKMGGVVISKSGQTLETLFGFYHFSAQLEKILAITDAKKGELRRLCTTQGWDSFEIPENIGGRFSVLTAVGLLPCALVGIPIGEIVEGALEQQQFLQSVLPEENPALRLAWALHALDQKGFHEQYLMPYWSALEPLADWFVQLWGESLGKAGKGPTPGRALGTSDQHSLLQLFKQGPKNKVIGFLKVKKEGQKSNKPNFESPSFAYLADKSVADLNRLACEATAESLARSEVPSYTLSLPEVSPKALGALLYFYQMACAYAGELYGVNAYDQPGVEEAKKLLHDALTQ